MVHEIPIVGSMARIHDDPIYTQSWFSGCALDMYLKSISTDISSRPFHILEIGAFEGLGTLSMLSSACTHPDSFIVSVDPFMETDRTTPVDVTTGSRFLTNISTSPDAHKVQFHMITSLEYMWTNPHRQFDLVYIDGSHEIDDIRLDILGLVGLVKSGGVLWMDDYLGGHDTSIKTCIDECVEEITQTRLVQVLHSGYQLGLKIT
jgi:predicted O-methyltransferase YrrM